MHCFLTVIAINFVSLFKCPLLKPISNRSPVFLFICLFIIQIVLFLSLDVLCMYPIVATSVVPKANTHLSCFFPLYK